MATHRAPLAALAALTLLAGCPAPGTIRPDSNASGGKASPRASAGVTATVPAARVGVTIAGLAIAPAGIVAAGAGNVLVNNGGNMVAAGAGNVISHNGGQAIGAGGLVAGPRTLLAIVQQPLAGAEVFLAGPDGAPLPDIPPVTTDAQGRFRLAGAPATGTFTVQVRVKNKAGAATTLQTLVRPTAAGATANVSIGTTCVAVAVLDGQGGNLGEFNPAKFQSAVETTDKELTPETWPDPADRQAILATMTRLEAKIDLLQSTLNEIRAELQKLSNQVAGASLTPVATATAAPTGGPTTAPASASPAAGASPSAAGTTVADLALRAKLEGEGDANMRVIVVEGDSDSGEIIADDDGDVGGGVQFHLDQATFPATYRLYAQRDEKDLDPTFVRRAENLLGVLVVSGLGAGQSTFTRRAGATLSIAGGRLSPYFEEINQALTFTGALTWDPDDTTLAAPTGPVPIHIEAEGGDNWSFHSDYTLDESKGLGEAIAFRANVVEIPARFRVDVAYLPEGADAASETIGYIRIHRDYVTDALRVRFDREDDALFTLK